MDSLKHERENTGLSLRRANESKPRDLRQRLCPVSQDLLFVGRDPVHAEPLEVIDRDTEANGACNVRRPRLELVGHTVIERFLKCDRTDHVPTALIRRHLIQEARLAVEHADACRAVSLVAGENVELAVECPDIDLSMIDRLGAVDHDWYAMFVSQVDNLPNRINGAERVRHLD